MELDSSIESREQQPNCIPIDNVVNLQQVALCGGGGKPVTGSCSRESSTMSTLQSSSSSLSSTSADMSGGSNAPPARKALSVVDATAPGKDDPGGNVMASKSSAEDAKSTSIKEPTSGDILLRRGRVIDTRPGNMKFRRFLAQQLERYDQAPKFQKTEIAEGLLRHLKDTCRVRFLKELPAGNGFEEVDDKTAREKISRTFRRIRETKRGGGNGNGNGMQ